ncbi:MAG: acyl--CoA ligase [Clostridiales bacterium]|jgi:long-chain acyl-CoA synthetase|nr:acyl--CoA ligase [Clostridiales bacterium]
MTAHMSMYEFLTRERHAKDWDSWNAVVCFGKRLKFGRLIAGIDGIAYYLSKNGIKKGDGVAICLPNIPPAVMAFYAVNKCGAVANIIHPMISEYGLLNIIKKTAPKLIFIADIFYEKYKTVLSDIGIAVVVCPMNKYASPIIKIGIAAKKAKEKVLPIAYGGKVARFADTIKKRGRVDVCTGGGDVAAYLHSGGTTGESKTIVLSNYAINAVAINATAGLGCSIENDAGFMVLPIFHGFGLAINMHAALGFGCRIVMLPKFTVKEAVRIIKKEKISFIVGVPTMYEKLLNDKRFRRLSCKNFRFLICGGDSLNPVFREKFDAHVASRGGKARLLEGYGLTEIVTVSSFNTPSQYRAGSVGKPILGVEAKIVDDNGIELPRGSYGEILLSGPGLMEGYYNDEITTNEVIKTDENGKRWLKTGDCGLIDDDGFIFFKDRIKRMIIIAGVNIFPSEIEEVVSLMPEIKMCCAVEGRTKENKIIIKLFVVLNDGYKYSLTLENKIIKTCADNLIKFAVPGKVIAKKSLPVTIVGKVNYRLVEQMNDEE